MSLSFEDTGTTQQPVYALTASWVDGSRYTPPNIITTTTPVEPTITLKRGRVEISIKNAASIVQRMEELFPKNERYGSGHSWTRSQEKTYDHDKNRAWVVAAKNWFKQEFYGTNDEDFDIVISNEQPAVALQQNMSLTPDKFAPLEPERTTPLPFPCPPPVEKTVNKNAYEIRESILDKSIDIVKYSTVGVKCDTDNMVNKILDVASKLYEFVENKKYKKY